MAHTSRHRVAMLRTSPNRSSWSRVRLPRTRSSVRAGRPPSGTQRSSTSSTAIEAARSRPSAAATPAGMLAPVWFETTGGASARRASASNRVVVVLPLVADTIATRRPAATSASRSGAMAEHHPAADLGAGATPGDARRPAGGATGRERRCASPARSRRVAGRSRLLAPVGVDAVRDRDPFAPGGVGVRGEGGAHLVEDGVLRRRRRARRRGSPTGSGPPPRRRS